MSRIKRTQNRKSKKKVIIPVLLLIIFLFFVYSKYNFNNSSSAEKSPSNNTSLNSNNEVSTSRNDNSTSSSKENTNIVTNMTTKSNSTSNKISSSSNKTSSNKTNYVVDLPSTKEASKGNSITVDKATSLLKDKLDSKNSHINVSYDHTQLKDNVNYYVFQGFSSNSSSENTDTLGWYYVNCNSGDLFSYDINTDKLNSLK